VSEAERPRRVAAVSSDIWAALAREARTGTAAVSWLVKKMRVTQAEAERMILVYAEQRLETVSDDVNGVWPLVRANFRDPSLEAHPVPQRKPSKRSRARQDDHDLLLGAAYSGDRMEVVAAVLSHASQEVTSGHVERCILDRVGFLLGPEQGSTLAAIYRTLRESAARGQVIPRAYEERRRAYEQHRLQAELAEWRHRQQLWVFGQLDAADTWLLSAAAGDASESEIGLSADSPFGRQEPELVTALIRNLSFRLQLTPGDATCETAREALRTFLCQVERTGSGVLDPGA
jgi:hypothetical protein